MFFCFGSPFTFTGELTDANALLYLRARYYSPALGVFTALDPMENLNRYQYVGANPVNAVDPSGLQETNCWERCRWGEADYGLDFAVDPLPRKQPFLSSAFFKCFDVCLKDGLNDQPDIIDALNQGDFKKAAGLALVPVAEGWNWATEQVYEHPEEASLVVGVGLAILATAVTGNPIIGIGAATNVIGNYVFNDRYSGPADESLKKVVIDAGIGGITAYGASRLIPGMGSATWIRRATLAGGFTTTQGTATRTIDWIVFGGDLDAQMLLEAGAVDFTLGFSTMALVDRFPLCKAGDWTDANITNISGWRHLVQGPPYGAKYLRALSRYNAARRYLAEYLYDTPDVQGILFLINSNILGPIFQEPAQALESVTDKLEELISNFK